MTAVAREGTPLRPHRLRQRLRAAVLGPHGRPDRRAHQRGHSQDQAVAAVLIQRLFTAYLPLVWGFATLTWMRRREYV